MTRRANNFVIIWVQGMYIKRSFGSVHKNLGEFKTIWTCPPNVLDLKMTQAKMSFTVYMQIEPSATEKVNF